MPKVNLKLVFYFTIIFPFLINCQKLEGKCGKTVRIRKEKILTFQPRIDCSTKLVLKRGLMAQVSCDNVDSIGDNCPTMKRLVIESKGGGAGDHAREVLCLRGHDEDDGINAQVDSLYDHASTITLSLVTLRDRSLIPDPEPLLNCLISVKKKPKPNQKARSLFETQPGNLELLDLASQLYREPKCGEVKKPPVLRPRIVGGQEAVPNNYPWMVLVVKVQAGRGILCGGSIVSTRFILTAAHCVDKADKIRVYFGVHKLSQAARIWKDVDEWTKHPEYQFPKHDIALMKITPGIKYSNNIKPVCLPNLFSKGIKTDDNLIGLGWGKTSEKIHISKVLKENWFTVISDRECRLTFGKRVIADHIMCTKDAARQSVCQGDSGSSVGKMEAGKFVLYGLISFTTSTCFEGNPTGYTEIEPHLKWIQKNIR